MKLFRRSERILEYWVFMGYVFKASDGMFHATKKGGEWFDNNTMDERRREVDEWNKRHD